MLCLIGKLIIHMLGYRESRLGSLSPACNDMMGDLNMAKSDIMLKESIRKLESGEPLEIIALGDSLTHGWMVRKGYIDFINEMLKIKYPCGDFQIINRGIPGDTAEGGFHRLESDVIDYKPGLIFIQFGLNDAFSGVSPEGFKNTIRRIVERIRSATEAEILLVTSVPVMDESGDLMIERFYNVIIDVSREQSVPVAQVHRYWKEKIAGGVNHGGLVQFDGVHPTVEGYRLMAEAIMEML